MPEVVAHGAAGPAVLYRFDADRITIGRDESADLVIRDPSVSRLHAEFRREGARWRVVDLGSTNGTLLNGRAITGPEWLSQGDEIGVATTRLVFGPASADAVAEGSAPHTVRLPWTSRGDPDPAPRALIGRSLALAEVRRVIAKIADAPATVLITGESGTGKEVVAWLLHHQSRRAARPYVAVNCAALPGSLLEAELLGVASGVATGVEARPGRFEEANGGTLLLDEIGDMDLGAQAKLLRVLEERTVQRLGGRNTIALTVRVVAATNHDLKDAIGRGSFRRDLYHRLNVVHVVLPPLRDRPEDVSDLIDHFLALPRGLEGAIEPGARARLVAHDWPGNVRELHHVLERARLLAATRTVTVADLPPELREGYTSAAVAASPAPSLPHPPHARADELYAALVAGQVSFWSAVREPFLRRELSADDVRRVVRRLHHECGGSYKELARRLGIAADYKKLLNFLHFHRLGVDS